MGNPNIKDYGFGGKHRTKAQDDEYRSRIAGVPRQRKWSKDVCIEQLEDIMDLLKKKIYDDDFKELTVITDKMMDIIRYLYPPVQQNVNVNLEVTTDAVIERLKNWKREQVMEVVVPGATAEVEEPEEIVEIVEDKIVEEDESGLDPRSELALKIAEEKKGGD